MPFLIPGEESLCRALIQRYSDEKKKKKNPVFTRLRTQDVGHVKRAPSVIYRCVPPTHEYGTRPFLRWVRSQGRSPHTSGKAKNTFGPVGIPLFGAPQAPGNNPPFEGGKSLGGWPPEAGGNLQYRGTPCRTAQR